MQTTRGPQSNGSVRSNGKDSLETPTKDRPAPGAWRMGMFLFLVSLGILFLASMVATIVIRLRTGVWPPPGMPPPPPRLWVSTAILAVSSITMQWAVESARRNRKDSLKVAMISTTLLAIAFLTSQVMNWWEWVGQSATIRSSLYAYLFYVLTGLHAAHVLGGLVPLVVVSVNAVYGRYSSLFHNGVRQCAIYWHFLGVIWALLFTVILATTSGAK
jgi:cytochrome c oxidase subunit 3